MEKYYQVTKPELQNKIIDALLKLIEGVHDVKIVMVHYDKLDSLYDFEVEIRKEPYLIRIKKENKEWNPPGYEPRMLSSNKDYIAVYCSGRVIAPGFPENIWFIQSFRDKAETLVKVVKEAIQGKTWDI